ncbi:MAG: helix-turn-helix transcriptional regulator [Acutalibacteraceae bacterium]|nr:helix-turn-helix transcriptional regulator [Acutalibacteraceae bacterium]
MLGDKIREIRLAKKISQVELAKMLDVTKQSVSNWENENIQPSIEMLSKIADVFNISTDFLLSRDDRRYLDVSGVSEKTIQNLQAIIDEIREKNT